MNRRHFLRIGAPAALADTRKRVGLIGSGGYGKGDLSRLLQVAPVEVVSLCDVDSAMLADAAEGARRRAGALLASGLH